MSATNKTTHYELPVFVGGDMPGWLTDFNGAMNAIDAGIYEAKSAGDGAQSSADTANANITTLSGTVDGIGGRVTTLEGTVTSQGGNIDTINSLIGHGEPTTQDKTIIGAINELAAEIPGPGPIVVDADDVTYDNTSSGLTATNIQNAIDEVNSKITGEVIDLDLSTNVSATVTSTETVTAAYTGVNVLTNANASIGKVYGSISIESSGGIAGGTSGAVVATITASNLPTIATDYYINVGFANVAVATSGVIDRAIPARLHFKTDGTIDVEIFTLAGSFSGLKTVSISLAPCLLFLKDLGD